MIDVDGRGRILIGVTERDVLAVPSIDRNPSEEIPLSQMV